VGVTPSRSELNFAGTFTHHFHNLLTQSRLEVEPMAGIEPATDGLRNRCSTTELHWLKLLNKIFKAVISTTAAIIFEKVHVNGKLIRHSSEPKLKSSNFLKNHGG
jgi:hypothetical protein